MRSFKEGKFERNRVPVAFQRFSPHAALDSLYSVDLEELKQEGKRLLLLDVDNTLLPWKSREIPAETFDWINRAKNLGFELCILSNTRHPERLKLLCEQLEIDFLRDKFKPNPRVYKMALEKHGVPAEQAIMIGDQLLTDVWGANRAGIDAIWVKPMAKKEFIGTAVVSRKFEWLIGQVLHGYLVEHSLGDKPRSGLFQQKIVAQAVKFAFVGGLVTVVDWGLHRFLMFGVRLGDGTLLREAVGTAVLSRFSPGVEITADAISGAAYGPLKVLPVILAILVSYLLNRWFTFEPVEEKSRLTQMIQFYVIALIGGLISTTVGTVVNALVHGSLDFQWISGNMAGMIAAFIWNFNGQRIWTFREAK